MARNRVIVEDHFRELNIDLDRIAARALNQAAEVGAATARSTPTGKYKIQGITGKTHAEAARPARKGWTAGIVCPDYRAIFFTKGTYSRRSGKLKRARASTSGNQGVRATRFMQKGRTAAARALLPLLQRNAGKWKP